MRILSERNYEKWASYQVVYEYEDIMADKMQISIGTLYKCGKIGRKIRHFITKFLGIGRKFKKSFNYDLVWIMSAEYYRLFTHKKVIPIFLDFPAHMADEIIFATKELPIFWVTAYDVYSLLISKGCKNVRYTLLSVSDTLISRDKTLKDIDVIQFGRKNNILHEYMINYCKKNPEINYVYQSENGTLTYVSTQGNILGKFDKRKEYFDLLRRCRISLVSTPGIDKGRDFGGVDFFTPRFYESVAAGAILVGRYTENEESRLIGIRDICTNIETEEQFETVLERYLDDSFEYNEKSYDIFLSENCTSKRIENLKRELNELFLTK